MILYNCVVFANIVSDRNTHRNVMSGSRKSFNWDGWVEWLELGNGGTAEVKYRITFRF